MADYNPYVFGNSTVSGSSASSRLRNPDLKWETTTTFNAGVDFALFTNMLRGTLEYYNATTSDLLLDRQLASSTGFNVTRFNVGELQNQGLELSLNGSLINKTDLSFDMGIMWSKNKNKKPTS